ncbi:PAAR domain-containing protein [Pseudomonas profundi]|uniref:PAAR domain-containing protein n=1 Tax=Pseudomonas profundi TaxID=1981513 RepID=UPI00123B3E3D|nr:PAAR domain-containing protein [Pseudomonas profundi]
MSGKPAARMGDPTQCPKDGHGSNAIVTGSTDVLFDGQPAARQGDQTACGSAIDGTIIPSVLINGRPAAVLGSTGSHGDVITGGSGTITIGGNVSTATDPGGESHAASAPSVAAGAGSLLAPGLDDTAGPLKENTLIDGLPYSLEEEEEEEEERELPLQQRITLRVGMFFDGTGNNLGNAAFTAECRRQDLHEFDEQTLTHIRQLCETYDYRDTDGDGRYDQLPGSSYGNERSNVALLYDLYEDQSDAVVEPTAVQASLKVYIDGIGTTGGSDDVRWGQATGKGKTGIVARVQESPSLVTGTLRRLVNGNPKLLIEKIEFDIFGFSRGAAAARHFANEVLKPNGGVFAAQLNEGLPAMAPGFEWLRHVSINFISLFDTVAAVLDPLRGDVNVGGERNPGINLYMPPGCARKVVHLTAADEHRHNFSLNRVDDFHEELALPGMHSNLGGGYPLLIRERVLIGRPRLFRDAYYSMQSVDRTKLVRSREWRARAEEERQLLERGLPGEGGLISLSVRLPVPGNGRNSQGSENMLLALGLDRPVHGELSRIALRIMHAKATEDHAAFKPLPETPVFAIPEDLKPIADKVIYSAMAGRSATLDKIERRFLHSKYIHSSANWSSVSGLLVNKPRNQNKRALYADRPQRGYPV